MMKSYLIPHHTPLCHTGASLGTLGVPHSLLLGNCMSRDTRSQPCKPHCQPQYTHALCGVLSPELGTAGYRVLVPRSFLQVFLLRVRMEVTTLPSVCYVQAANKILYLGKNASFVQRRLFKAPTCEASKSLSVCCTAASPRLHAAAPAAFGSSRSCCNSPLRLQPHRESEAGTGDRYSTG